MPETLDDLRQKTTEIKRQIDALHEESRAISEEKRKLIEEEHVARARESMQAWADSHGKTLQEAIEYWEGRLTFEDGTSPDPGRWIQSLLLQGKPGKVQLG